MKRRVFNAVVGLSLLTLSACRDECHQIAKMPTPAALAPTTREADHALTSVTRVSPEEAMGHAVALFEPELGKLSYEVDRICNGRVLHTLKTERFDSKSTEYSWIEIRANFDPETSRSTLEVRKMRHWWAPFGLSGHGGFWPFPVSDDTDVSTDAEKQMLLRLLQHIGDPKSETTK